MAMKTMIRPQPLVVLVMLYGVLGARFGRVHHLAVASGAEAIHALCVKIPGFKRFLRFSEERGLNYAIFRGKKNLSESEIGMRQDTVEPIRIAPIVIGSKGGGLFATIAGLALVVIGAVTQQYYLVAAGAGLMIGGIAMSMSPSPAGILDKEGDGNRPSYAFGGAVTTMAQGRCKPLLYGERDIGGALISAGIFSEDQQ
ncbi:tail assembly protein [Pseudomonas lundensis]|uniref:tail assembly protein n=1 Tax=Pseudomonas lundensis TaxID=86185 RepID=UPI000ABF250A|nr:tail assembly protein [Pseudomonas lundensis]MBM1183513.1 tail assembly protein [Pseudomonas lundensis]MCT8955164.1 tail assembly protein [Pseudomonas lundensis]NNA20470.1 tail assembly protein [Pseudomonas lundensis]NNA37561.1 tail assembly protein [Pseudomonas lundensis]